MVVCVNNPIPLGFGANHNRAFQRSSNEYFCVLNPDVELAQNPFNALLNILDIEAVGCAYPLQTNKAALPLDFERELVSPLAIAKRYFYYKYHKVKNINDVDWVSGSFLVFKSSVFQKLNGFDERYFMYCEDVDICLRLQLSGYQLSRAYTTVIHDTQRKTLKNFRHLFWHVQSLFRLWNSQAYKDYKYRLRKR